MPTTPPPPGKTDCQHTIMYITLSVLNYNGTMQIYSVMVCNVYLHMHVMWLRIY